MISQTEYLEQAGIVVDRSQHHKLRVVILVDADDVSTLAHEVRKLSGVIKGGCRGSVGCGSTREHVMFVVEEKTP